MQPVSPPLFGRGSPQLELWDNVWPDRWEKRIDGDLKFLPLIKYSQPQSIIRGIIEENRYAIRAAYIQGGNPLLSYSNARRVMEAFKKLEFVAVADMFMTPTAAFADIVLPAASYLEFDSIVKPPYSYPMISVQQKVARTGESRSDYEIVNGLARKLGLEEYFWESEEECLDYVLKPAGLSFDELRKVAIIPGNTQYRSYETKTLDTPSGKIELYSNRLKEWGLDPLPAYYESPETPYSDPGLAKEYPLVLTTWKSAPYRHSGGRQIPTLRGSHPQPVVTIHPETADALGIEQGNWVYIETQRGRIRQKACLTPDISPRVVGVDYAWWFPEKGPEAQYGWEESNVNLLTDDKPPFNKEMGSAILRGIVCKVYK